METEFKQITLDDFEVKQDGESNVIEGYASTFGNKDSVGDIVVAGAFKKSIRAMKPKMLWQHRSDSVIGVFDTLKEDDRGLYVKGRFADTSMGRDVAELARMGAIDAMSIGYGVDKHSVDEKKRCRYLEEVKLYEVSLVTFPANDQAKITSAKSIETVREFEQFLRDAGFSRKDATAIASSGFKAIDPQRDAGLESLSSTLDNLIQQIRS